MSQASKKSSFQFNSPVCHPDPHWSDHVPLFWCCHPVVYQTWQKRKDGNKVVKTETKYQCISIFGRNSPNLQTNLVYNIVNISQRLRRHMKEIASHRQSYVHLEVEIILIYVLETGKLLQLLTLMMTPHKANVKRYSLTRFSSTLQKQYISLSITSLAEIQKRNPKKNSTAQATGSGLQRHLMETQRI